MGWYASLPHDIGGVPHNWNHGGSLDSKGGSFLFAFVQLWRLGVPVVVFFSCSLLSSFLQFPFFCSDREYIIGRRIWESERTYYCVTKVCEVSENIVYGNLSLCILYLIRCSSYIFMCVDCSLWFNHNTIIGSTRTEELLGLGKLRMVDTRMKIFSLHWTSSITMS